MLPSLLNFGAKRRGDAVDEGAGAGGSGSAPMARKKGRSDDDDDLELFGIPVGDVHKGHALPGGRGGGNHAIRTDQHAGVDGFMFDASKEGVAFGKTWQETIAKRHEALATDPFSRFATLVAGVTAGTYTLSDLDQCDNDAVAERMAEIHKRYDAAAMTLHDAKVKVLSEFMTHFAKTQNLAIKTDGDALTVSAQPPLANTRDDPNETIANLEANINNGTSLDAFFGHINDAMSNITKEPVKPLRIATDSTLFQWQAPTSSNFKLRYKPILIAAITQIISRINSFTKLRLIDDDIFDSAFEEYFSDIATAVGLQILTNAALSSAPGQDSSGRRSKFQNKTAAPLAALEIRLQLCIRHIRKRADPSEGIVMNYLNPYKGFPY